MGQICFLFGHSELYENIVPQLVETITKHYEDYGVRQFIVGHYGSFDAQAAHALRIVKQSHPDITLRLLLPYHPAERPVPVPEGFDCTYFPEGMEQIPRKFAIVRANRLIILSADSVICYVKYIGNSRNLLRFAQHISQSNGLICENIANS